MLNTNRFSWKDNKLYLGDKDTKYSIEPFVAFYCQPDDGMFKVKFPDGELSKDFYNLPWAKTNAIRACSLDNLIGSNQTEKPAGAFK